MGNWGVGVNIVGGKVAQLHQLGAAELLKMLPILMEQ
jgi:hypothetical protein